LLNATPDTTGRIPESHVARYREFGEAIRAIYANKKGESAGKGNVLALTFEEPVRVDHIITMEDIRYGHIVRAYVIEGQIGGAWKKLATGSSIGYKRIDVVEPVVVKALRFRATETVDEPVIKSFAAYEAGTRPSAAADEESNLWIVIEDWKRVRFTRDWQIAEVDLTCAIQRPGQYTVELRKTGGSGTLEVKDAVLLIAGTEAPRLLTPLNQPNAWQLRRTDQVIEGEKGRTALRLTVRLAGDGAWHGDMVIKAME
jgi:alpha-L-fucosidase